ncbi:phospholipase effector Tle1 domain-containing protein [Massilia sp. TWR1-2-2]|uniref:phospholipase effector Tle1 domain-containing protein n=1 Tax=Massilia sp. TWR1-2-2 TaxID=2804584 RepID=UPI003CEA3023
MNIHPLNWLKLRGVVCAILFISPLLAACSKPLPVSIHGVNYTVEPFSYVLTDPNDPKNTGGGELIDSYAAGGTMCCYDLPRKWQPGIKVSVRVAHWKGKYEEKSLQQIVSTHLAEVPRYADGKPGELWVLRSADGSIDLVSSDFQPNHPQWPGKVKGWPVPSLSYKRERWDIYIREEQGTVRLYQKLLSEFMESPIFRAKEAWDFSVKNDRKSIEGYSGPDDIKYLEALRRDYENGLVRSKQDLVKLEKGAAMSTFLCPRLPISYSSAAVFEECFDKLESKTVLDYKERERPILNVASGSCKTNIFFGFFFDGTRNNYVLAEKRLNHSNVARLYDCYPGLSVPNVLPKSTDWEDKDSKYSHYFKTYIPGVSSPFKEVNDSGDGAEGTRGAAMGFRGEARIIWALLQSINNIHRFFYHAPLVSAAEATKLAMLVDLGAHRRRAMDVRSSLPTAGSNEDGRTRDEFAKILRRLHFALAQHWPDKKTGWPNKFAPSIVQTIHVSIFGFSRGAAQARAFANWLIELCRLDAQLSGRGDAMTLGGFKLEIDFLGLFDTVASVGAGNTFGNSWLGRLFDGHGTWADTEGSLRIPQGIRCVHLVAAHEIRRSFPLDSIAVGQVTPENSEEVVFPGVHSDLGCGYSPREQGRGLDVSGEDMLARIPLLYMYKKARLAGVPLKLEEASGIAKKRFELTPSTIHAFNAYLAQSTIKVGTLTAIMREQARLQMEWRLARRSNAAMPLETSRSFERASIFDQNDLHSANLEFDNEVAAFENWRKQKGPRFVPVAQPAGFANEHDNEWEEIATWWDKARAPHPAVSNFFDEYVHDSRAWFKLIPGNPDNEPDMIAKLANWAKTCQRVKESNLREQKKYEENQRSMHRLFARKPDASAAQFQPMHDGLTDDQRRAAEEYSRTGKIPRMLTEGREPFNLVAIAGRAGYLRFRKIYGGHDSVLISQAEESDPNRKEMA